MTTEVAIVGGGIVGCATAYYLAQRGVASTIIERDGIAAHASGFAYGGLNPTSGAGIPGPMSPLARWAFGLHASLADALSAAGCAIGYRRRDTLQLAFSKAEAEALAAAHERLPAVDGIKATLLDAPTVRQHEPRVAEDVAAGLLLEGSAEVDARALTQALAQQAAASLRVESAESLAGRNGHACGIRTSHGVIPCQAVVLAPGPWRNVHSALPFAPLKGEILRLRTQGPPLVASIGWGGNYATTKPDGLVWAGTTEEQAGFDATPSATAKDAILARLGRILPGLTVAGVAQHTACLRPMTADGLAVLGRLPQWDNVYVAGGGGRKGVLYGPAMGLAMAQLVVGEEPELDLSPYAPGRFG